MMNQYFGVWDQGVLAVYFVCTMGIGAYFWQRSRSTEGFTAAGRSLPGWVCGLSIFATYLSSISFLALPGKAFVANWNSFAFSLSLPVATWIAVTWFLPYYRKSGEVSAYANLEHRFGPWARTYAGTFYLLTQIARMGTVMYLMALPMNILLGWDLTTVILVTGLAVTAYAFVGGLVAVIWADALQAMVLTVGAIVCVIVMLAGLPEGPGQVLTLAAEHHKFSLGSFKFSAVESTFWVVVIYGLFINLQNFGIDQSYVQRYVASKSSREAMKGVWLGGLIYVPVSALFFFIGTTLFAYYHTHPADMQEVKTIVARQALQQDGLAQSDPTYEQALADTQASLTDGDIGDKVFPHFIGAKLPRGLTGLLIAAVFAAAMSTVSTSLNSSATLVMTDFYQRYLKPDATEKQRMRVLHGATIVWGVLGTAIALCFTRVESALDTWWMLASIFSGGIVGLFLLGMISRHASNAAAATGVCLGALVICWMVLSQQAWWPASLSHLKNPLHDYMTIVVGTLTILVTGLCLTLISRLFKGTRP